jgi:hypothetical protein
MPFCSKCGVQVSEEMNYCFNCGMQLKAARIQTTRVTQLPGISEISTDKAAYVPGELVTVSGKADSNRLVGLQVTNPLGTILLLVSVQANPSGTFNKTFRLPFDAPLGTYTVAANGKNSTFLLKNQLQ